jgi:hypothetical protein
MAQAKLMGSEQEEDEYKAYCALPAPTEKIQNLFEYW